MCKINLEERNLEVRLLSFYDGVIQLSNRDANEVDDEELYFDRLRVFDYGAFTFTLIHEEEDVAELVIPFEYLPKAIPIKLVRNLLVDSFDNSSFGERSHIFSAIEFFGTFIHGMSRERATKDYIIEVAKYLHYTLDGLTSYMRLDANRMKDIVEEAGETVFSEYYEKSIDKIYSISIRDQKINFSSYGEKYTISFDSIELCFSNRSSTSIIKIKDKEGRIIKLKISENLIEHEFPYPVLNQIWKDYHVEKVDEDFEKKWEAFRPFIQGIVNLIVNNSEQTNFDFGYLTRAIKLKHLLSKEVEEETDNIQEKKTREELTVKALGFDMCDVKKGELALITEEKEFVIININGATVEIKPSSSFINIDLNWKNGGVIRLRFPFSKFYITSFTYHVEVILNEISQIIRNSRKDQVERDICKKWLLFFRKFLNVIYNQRKLQKESQTGTGKGMDIDTIIGIINKLKDINALEELCDQK